MFNDPRHRARGALSFRELVAQTVDVEPEFAGREARARRRLLLLALDRGGAGRRDLRARHDQHAVPRNPS